MADKENAWRPAWMHEPPPKPKLSEEEKRRLEHERKGLFADRMLLPGAVARYRSWLYRHPGENPSWPPGVVNPYPAPTSATTTTTLAPATTPAASADQLATWEGRARDFGYTVTPQQSPTGTGAYSPEILSVAKALGVDPATLVGAGDPTDPTVYVGGTWKSVEPGMGDLTSHWGKVWYPQPGLTKKLSQVETDFYRLEPDELRRFQEDAFAAGLYPNTVKSKADLPLGDYDEETFQIWSKLAQRSAMMLQADKRKSLWDVLADAKKNAPATSPSPVRDPLVIRLTHPDDLQAILGAVASSVTGGKSSLSDEQARQFVVDVHNAERAAQRGVYEAGGSGLPGGPGGEVVDVPNAAEQARKRVQAANPQDAQAYSYIESFNRFKDLLQGAGQ